jgi:excisionase family DNA binding protein
MTEERLSLRDAADQLGVSEVTARRWIKTGKLQAYKPGLKYLIPTSAVEGLLKSTDASKKEASLRATSREIYATWPEERRKSFGMPSKPSSSITKAFGVNSQRGPKTKTRTGAPRFN